MALNARKYGLLKSGLDAHTLGISAVSQLLEQCGLSAAIADAETCSAVDHISNPAAFSVFKSWVMNNKITDLGFSYRLDPHQAVEVFGKLMHQIDNDSQLSPMLNGILREIYFAGLHESCVRIQKKFNGRFQTFKGDETATETLSKLGVPSQFIPKAIIENSVYDDLRIEFGQTLIQKELHHAIKPGIEYSYKEYGTTRDSLICRLNQAQILNQLPLIRAHVGPYLADRASALALFSDWLKKLSQSRLLDIVSVGSSQLSQSNFGEDWQDMPNGGGVPFNSEAELRAIWQDAMPMLVRAYSGTKNVPAMAQILEKNLNMAWHALSLWWFNQLDGRGPLSLARTLHEHFEAIRFIAQSCKPFEPNTSHHFAFRGSDDVTYLVSAYLAARTAKLLGIRHLVLQNMLNTPKSTWGVSDLAKSRALLKLIKSLEDRNFRIIYQPRAGLDYFSPDPEKAKQQLVAVTALMADVAPENDKFPEIIHVVSHSEALFLANPDVINESIRLTKAALKHYPAFRKTHFIRDLILNQDIENRTNELIEETTILLNDMQKNILNLYSGEGLYNVFKMGYLPVPYLWAKRDEFPNAVAWQTRPVDGRVCVVDKTGKKMNIFNRLGIIKHLNN